MRLGERTLPPLPLALPTPEPESLAQACSAHAARRPRGRRVSRLYSFAAAGAQVTVEGLRAQLRLRQRALDGVVFEALGNKYTHMEQFDVDDGDDDDDDGAAEPAGPAQQVKHD
eukprot:g6085.t1